MSLSSSTITSTPSITFFEAPINNKITSLTGHASNSPSDYTQFFSHLANAAEINLQEASATIQKLASVEPFSQSPTAISHLMAWVLNKTITHQDSTLFSQRALGLLLDYCPLEHKWLEELLPHNQTEQKTARIYHILTNLSGAHCQQSTLDRIKNVVARINQIKLYSNQFINLTPSERLYAALVMEMKFIEGNNVSHLPNNRTIASALFYDRIQQSLLVPITAFGYKTGTAKYVAKSICLPKDRNQPFSIKALLLNKKPRIESYISEYEIHKELTTKKIVGIWPFESYTRYTAILDGICQEQLFATMKWADGTLTDFMKPNARANIETLLGIAYQLAEAFAYIHGINLVHGDLKSENVLCGYKEGVLSIGLTDLGLAFYTDQIDNSLLKKVGFYGSVYCSPFEYLGNVDSSLDPRPGEMWAFGYLLLQLYYIKDPAWTSVFMRYWNQKLQAPQPVLENDRQNLIDIHHSEVTLQKARIISKYGKSQKERLQVFIYNLLNTDREHRPTAKQALAQIKKIQRANPREPR